MKLRVEMFSADMEERLGFIRQEVDENSNDGKEVAIFESRDEADEAIRAVIERRGTSVAFMLDDVTGFEVLPGGCVYFDEGRWVYED